MSITLTYKYFSTWTSIERASLENKNNTNSPVISLKFMLLSTTSTNSKIQYRNIPDPISIFSRETIMIFLLPAAIYGKLVSTRCQNIGRDRQRCHGVINTRLSKSNGSFIHQAGRSATSGAVIAKARNLDDRERDGWFT